MKRRDLVKQLIDAGYHIGRDKGSHTVFVKEGCQPVAVPRHTEIKEPTAQTIRKQAGLK